MRDSVQHPSQADVPADARAGQATAQIPSLDQIGRFVAAIAALCALAAFPASALFDLQEVGVAGNRVVPASEILRRAGIAPGESAFRVNAARIRARELWDPRIQDVAVAMVFPRRVTILVRERGAAAALPVPGGYVLLGGDGVVIERVSTPASQPLLRTDPADRPAVQAGTIVPSAAVRLGARVAGMLPDSLREAVRAVRVTAGPEVTLEMRDGVAVRLGGPHGIAGRVRALPEVIAAIDAQGLRVEYVDVRFPGSIIIRPLRMPGLRSERTPPAGARGTPEPGARPSDRQEKPPER